MSNMLVSQTLKAQREAMTLIVNENASANSVDAFPILKNQSSAPSRAEPPEETSCIAWRHLTSVD